MVLAWASAVRLVARGYTSFLCLGQNALAMLELGQDGLELEATPRCGWRLYSHRLISVAHVLSRRASIDSRAQCQVAPPPSPLTQDDTCTLELRHKQEANGLRDSCGKPEGLWGCGGVPTPWVFGVLAEMPTGHS